MEVLLTKSHKHLNNLYNSVCLNFVLKVQYLKYQSHIKIIATKSNLSFFIFSVRQPQRCITPWNGLTCGRRNCQDSEVTFNGYSE